MYCTDMYVIVIIISMIINKYLKSFLLTKRFASTKFSSHDEEECFWFPGCSKNFQWKCKIRFHFEFNFGDVSPGEKVKNFFHSAVLLFHYYFDDDGTTRV